MKTDKTTIIGFILLGVLFFGFFWYNNKQQKISDAIKKHYDDSIARVTAAMAKPVDVQDSLHQDSVARTALAGDFTAAGIGQEQQTVVENDLIKATFSTKGGQLKSVVLKKYQSYSDSSQPVVIGGGKGDKIGYTINTTPATSAETADLFFTAAPTVKNADGSQTLIFTLHGANGESITHQYTIKPDQYLIDWNIGLNGANHLLTQSQLNLHWNTQLHQQQQSIKYEKEQSRIGYWQDGKFDFERAKAEGTANVDLDKPLQWVTFKQQFFNATLVSNKGNFNTGKAEMLGLADSTHELFDASANLRLQVPATASVNIPLQLYYGPNDYRILKTYDNGMKNIVDLGSGMFSFVKYINRGVIIPVFDFLAGFISNFGWVIALLTLFIRLVISPLTYSSYKSGAKMRVLRPELDELKKKFGSDQQGFAMEQMKIFREAGASPLGGCIPALLQIPIFFSLYSFFSSNIQLRGQSFLWAKDLSNYDSIWNFGAKIPLLGDHLSLFTLFTVITNLLISVYNMSSTPTTQDNPAMKYMPYIMPVVMLFWFNNLPSALTWYYTVSNVVTLLIQLVIQKVIINPDKLKAQIAEKRKAPKSKSKFAARFEQMAEMQKKMQDSKNKNK